MAISHLSLREGRAMATCGTIDAMGKGGLSPNTAISASEKGGQWKRVAPLLDEMRSKGLSPNVISFRTAISACDGSVSVWRHCWMRC
eukprot:12431500-Karenia_brevis.AAC.1